MLEDEVRIDEEDPREIVHWFDRAPIAPTGADVAALMATAFTAGALAAVGLLLLSGRLRD